MPTTRDTLDIDAAFMAIPFRPPPNGWWEQRWPPIDAEWLAKLAARIERWKAEQRESGQGRME